MPPQVAVIDTNAILAWLWFSDPHVHELGRALESGRVRWLATPPMRAELALVLQRLSPRAAEGADAQAALGCFDRLAELHETPALAHRLRCTDESDQMFLDLAVACNARWLFSRDRAVLRLRRRAAALGTEVRAPDDWQPDA